jgi:hypothetical protein
MRFSDLKFEFEKLESTDEIDSAQAATVTSHKDWRDLGVKKGLSTLLSSGRTQREKLGEAFEKYYNQGEPRKSDHETCLIEIC